MTPKIAQLIAGGTVAILLAAVAIHRWTQDPGPSPALVPTEKATKERRDVELRFEGPNGTFWIANGERMVTRTTTHRPGDDVVVRVRETIDGTNITSLPFLWQTNDSGGIVPVR